MQERPVHGPDPHVSGDFSRHRRRRANVYSYTMDVDGLKLSASPAILEFESVGDGTKLTLTSTARLLDGNDDPAERERGTRELFDMLGASLDTL
jgi:hypothetical protein